MIYDSMLALQELAPLSPMIWTIAIGALVILWLFIGLHNTGYIQAIVSVLLLGLTLYMGAHMISQWPSEASLLTSGNMSFIAALELSIAMPLSWLPSSVIIPEKVKAFLRITYKCYSLHCNKYRYVHLRS